MTAGGVALWVAVLSTPVLIRWLVKHDIGQHIRDDGPRVHIAQAGTPTFDQRIRLRMASINLAQAARQVAETVYLAAGATAVFESNSFERRFRDMHAVSQQAQSQFSIYEAIGRHFLGLPHGSRLV